MKLSAALENYLEDLKATAAAISHDLSNIGRIGNA
jgi:IclR family mhp operon transcriptional activator